jgi:hypothetical protein
MPIRASEKSRYPGDWKQISQRIRFERGGGLCEWQGCKAPHGEVIMRLRIAPEIWRSINGEDLCEADPDYRAVKVVLTVAHLDHQPENCEESNLMSLCQLHHLRLDKHQHRRNAATSRRARKNNLELFAIN